jgi:hypothetical protein
MISLAMSFEPKVTADLESLAQSHGGKLEGPTCISFADYHKGLEYKIKGKESFTRKLLDKITEERKEMNFPLGNILGEKF